MSDQDQDIAEMPPDICDSATNVINTNHILPEKSRKHYEKAYQDFMEWRQAKNKTSLSEFVLLAYFEELSTNFKATTLWTFYSMLKITLNLKHNIDIAKYSNLTTFLKGRNGTSVIKKSKTFSPEEIYKFLTEAPDKWFLMAKVALIFGIVGGCRRDELYKLMASDVHDFESTIIVTVRNSNTNTSRTFTIIGKYCQIVKKYMQLRPSECTETGFFLTYTRGKCSTKKVGINKFGCLGKTIAEYLDLPDPAMYTGHCFRRTSATILIDSGGDIMARELHGRWRHVTEPEGNVEDSIQNKVDIKTEEGTGTEEADTHSQEEEEEQMNVKKKVVTKNKLISKAALVQRNMKNKKQAALLMKEEQALKIEYQKQELAHQKMRHKLELEILLLEKEKKEIELELIKKSAITCKEESME